MADDGDVTQTAQAPAPDLSGLTSAQIADLYKQIMNPPPPAVPQNTGPSSREGRSFVSLLGEGLGGGQQYGTTAEREQGGFGALAALGARMLQASDYSYVPHSFGAILGQGLGAAQQQLGRQQAVSAAQQAAAQQTQHQQQQDQLARLRTALPLLQLQGQIQAADVARRIAAGGVAPPNVGDVGADTYVGAIGGHEGTAQNPRSSAVGVGQFLDKTWNDFATANPQYFAGMSPDQILAAKKDPAFGAKVGPIAIEWLAKQNADELQRKGVTPNGPLLGIAHYLGAGAAGAIAGAPDNAPISAYVDPAAVKSNPELANMTVGQMKARYANTPAPSFMKPPVAPGQASAPAMAPVGTKPANTPVTIPPAPGAGAGAGARPALPPPEAPIAPGAGSAQTAGPGVPTGSVIPPSPPGSAADVEAIKAGMIGAGADPTTLAPGSGSAPAPMPGAVVTAQAGEASRTPDPRYPDIVAGGVTQQHPGTMADFRAKEYVQPPKTEDFNPNLTPAQQGEFAALSRGIEKRNAILQAGGVPLAQQSQEAREIAVAREDLQAKIQAAAQAKAAAAATNQTKWDDKQDTQMQQRYDKRLEVYNAAAAEQQKQADARATAEQLAKTTAAQSDLTSRLASRQKNLDALDAEAKGSTDALHNLELTDTLSKAAGAASLLPANVRDWLVNTGAATPDQIQKWSAGAALEAANNRLIQSLKGTGFSRITNQDLTFLTNSSSGGLGTPEQFRDAKTAFLMTLLKRNNQFAAQVHNFVDTGMNLPQAHEAADEKLGPIIPRVPGAAEIAKFSQSPNARALWMFDNLEPGTFYKDERGRLRINTRSPADLRPPE